MKDFDYIQPETAKDAARFLEGPGWTNERARAFAGGQDLYGEMKTGLVAPAALVNLKAFEDGAEGQIERLPDGNLSLGALVRLSVLCALPGDSAQTTLLREAAVTVASPQVRSRATLGGNLCQRPRCLYYRRPEILCLKKGGDECFAYSGNNKYNAILGGGPSFIVHPSDLAPALVALDARVAITSPSGVTEMALADFFTLPSDADVTRENVLAPDHVLTQVTTHLPGGLDWRATYVKFQEREGFDFALSAVALALGLKGGRVAAARVVLGGVAPKPWRTEAAEAQLVGSWRGDEGGFERLTASVAEAALAGAEPLERNAYKIPLTKGLIRRALQHLLLS